MVTTEIYTLISNAVKALPISERHEAYDFMTSCKTYTCEGCKYAIVCPFEGFPTMGVEDIEKEEIIEQFMHNIEVCNGCNGCEEGCAVCGQWFPYVMPEKECPEEYNEAMRRLNLL